MTHSFSERFNPYFHAFIAAAYIWGIALFFRYMATANTDMDEFIGPIAVLSLLVFSVALMGFLFFYRPVVLMIENKKEDAAIFFIKTLGTFGALTVLVVCMLMQL